MDTPLDVLASFRLNSGDMIPFFICQYTTHFEFCTDAQRIRVLHLLRHAVKRPRFRCMKPLYKFASACLSERGPPRPPGSRLIASAAGMCPGYDSRRLPKASDFRAMLEDLARLRRVYIQFPSDRSLQR